MADGIADFLRSDVGMYVIGLPLVSAGIASYLMAMGVPMAAAGSIGLFTGGAVIGSLRGIFGAETTGMSKRELGQAAGIAALLTAVAYAFGYLGQMPAAQALVKAADQTAAQVAAGGNAAIGGILGLLAGLFTAFSMMLGTIAFSEFMADVFHGAMKR